MPYDREPTVEDVRWFGTKTRAKEGLKKLQREHENNLERAVLEENKQE